MVTLNLATRNRVMRERLGPSDTCRKASLYPKDPFEAAMTDAVVDTWRDLLDHFYACAFHRVVVNGVLTMRMRNPHERARRHATFITHEVRPTLEKLEALMLPSDKRHATSCNWADLAVFDVVRTLERTLPNGEQLLPAGRFPRLAAVVQVSAGDSFPFRASTELAGVHSHTQVRLPGASTPRDCRNAAPLESLSRLGTVTTQYSTKSTIATTCDR